MPGKNRKKRSFNGMSYHELQRANSDRRKQLRKDDQKWLKANSYKNVGWDNAIALYEKIEELLNPYVKDDLSLDELFLEADRIGNKYLTRDEIEEFNQKLAVEVGAIAEQIDQHFPDTEMEIIDFSKANSSKASKSTRKVKR